jgi:hypothetical protein
VWLGFCTKVHAKGRTCTKAEQNQNMYTILASPYQLSPQFAAITPFFNSMAGFLLSFAIIRHDVPVPCRLVVTRMASSLAGEKGRSCPFFVSLNSIPERSGQLF